MHYFHIDKLKKEPVYLQLANNIKKAILKGTLKHNDRLPTEEEIRALLNVSNVLVKQAYQHLIDEHLVRRLQGKGTFVYYIKPITLNVNKPVNLERLWVDYGIERVWLLSDLVDASAKETHYLELNELTKLNHFVWLGLKDEYPLVIQELFIPQATFKASKLSSEAYLAQIHRPEYSKIHEFSVETLDFIHARLLNVDTQTAAQSIRTVVKDRQTPVALLYTLSAGEYFNIEFSYGE